MRLRLLALLPLLALVACSGDGQGGASPRDAGAVDDVADTTTDDVADDTASDVDDADVSTTDADATPDVPCEGRGCPCAPDPLEPNDTPEVATEAAPGTYEGLHVCRDAPDVFALDAPAGATLTVEVEFDFSGRELGLILLDDAGDFVFGTVGDPPRIERELPEAGRSFVVVQLNVGDPVDYAVTFGVE